MLGLDSLFLFLFLRFSLALYRLFLFFLDLALYRRFLLFFNGLTLHAFDTARYKSLDSGGLRRARCIPRRHAHHLVGHPVGLALVRVAGRAHT